MDEKKVREAIEAVKCFPEWNRDDRWMNPQMMEGLVDTIIEALEKQLPKKPRTSKAYYGCPDCTTIRSLRQKHNYCQDCGQKLDWSE
ncbi:hypothetical protein [Parablautia sp. Marseille-Q6255]|uniref:hypothetical protein n=1 Tax=Parablautia sp. Marseille-Q6255 TaxID=3039593 RepID=UPI0024BD04BF|nr:hypothetical protein [Parablautia sp. Marseille-Q6255]